MSHKIVYYYQTFIGTKEIKDNIKYVTTLNLSAIHFGFDINSIPYIHLNDNNPYDTIFDQVWIDLEELQKMGLEIVLMVGGGGGAYKTLFDNFDTFYPLLHKLLSDKIHLISGIDLDIEEDVDINNVITLINRINSDFNFLTISMAPMATDLMYDEPGISGFVFKKLFKLMENKITRLHVQAYGNFTFDTFDKIVKNGYDPSKLIFGMVSADFSKGNFNNSIETIKTIVQKYSNINGIYNWEYFDSPPDTKHPISWAIAVYNALHNVNTTKTLSHLISGVKNYIFGLIWNS